MKDSKLIQIGGKSYKECEVVMLPTKNKPRPIERWGAWFFDTTDSKYSNRTNGIPGEKPGCAIEGQHLYILSSEEIKEGDWYIDFYYDNAIRQYNEKGHFYISNTNKSCKKIIATTDDLIVTKQIGIISTGKAFNSKPLPRTSNDFIKAFVKAQGKIDKVLVQYEYKGKEYVDEQDGIGYDKVVLKISPDNTVTIRAVEKEKTSWSREEAAERLYPLNYHTGQFNPNNVWKRDIFIKGAKWQQERMYSDMQEYAEFCVKCDRNKMPLLTAEDWYKQHKK